MLSWTHYRELLRVTEADARAWYAREAAEQAWSTRTLKRNIDTQYYQRLLLSGDKSPVVEEMERNTAPYQTREFKQAEFIKDPYMIEFLGLPEDERIRESAPEAALLANLQSFLLELGKGYAFMGRQFHLRGISGNKSMHIRSQYGQKHLPVALRQHQRRYREWNLSVPVAHPY